MSEKNYVKTKVVVDTNVFINAIFHKDSNSKWLFKLKQEGKLQFVMNKEMQTELLFVFYKLLDELIANDKADKLNTTYALAAILSLSLWQVEEIDHTTYSKHCTEDFDDNKFIDCCIDGEIQYLITQDTHLNSLASFLKKTYNIEVLSPFQLCGKYKLKQL